MYCQLLWSLEVKTFGCHLLTRRFLSSVKNHVPIMVLKGVVVGQYDLPHGLYRLKTSNFGASLLGC